MALPRQRHQQTSVRGGHTENGQFNALLFQLDAVPSEEAKRIGLCLLIAALPVAVCGIGAGRELRESTGRHDMQFRQFLAEVAQRSQGLRTG